MVDAALRRSYSALRREGYSASTAFEQAKRDRELSELEADDLVRFLWEYDDMPYDGDDPDGTIAAELESGELETLWVRLQVRVTRTVAGTTVEEDWQDASDALAHHGKLGFYGRAFVRREDGDSVPAFDPEGKPLYQFTPAIMDSLGGIVVYSDRRGKTYKREVECDLASQCGLIGPDAVNAPQG